MDHHHQSMATASMCSISKNNKQSKKQQEGGERSSSRGGGGNSPPATMRKGPWTEEEDAQLVWFVRLFGERRWDFLAKVSGLRRTGKSCRLRWVNYLHPDLRRGRITADEERLILQLHAQWGSRWSRIARSLPGRTDNEIKNFWRTRTRKQKAAQQQNSRSSKTASASAFSGSGSSSLTATTSSCSGSGSPSPSSGGCVTATSSSAVTESALRQSSGGGDNYDELDEASTTTTTASQHQYHHQQQQQQECYASDQFFWNDIAAAEAASYMFIDGWAGAGPGHPAAAAASVEPPSSPAWEYCSDYSLWRIDDDEYYKKMFDSS